MPTVIDSFVVELGLDPAKFTKGQQQAFDSAKKLEDQQTRSAKNIEYGSDRAGAAIGELRTQALQLFAVFTGGKGAFEFVKDLTNADAAVGRVSRNIGVSEQVISKWQGVARVFGGDAKGMAQSFTSISDAFAGWQIGKVSPLIADLRAISTAGGKIIDVNKGVEQSMFDLAENLKTIHDSGPDGPARAGLLGRSVGLDPALYDAMITGKLPQILAAIQKIGGATKESADAAGELERRWNAIFLKTDERGRQSGIIPGIIKASDILNMTPSEAYDYLTNPDSKVRKPGSPILPGTSSGLGSDAGNPAWRNAIANIESRGSGGYAAVGPPTRSGDQAYGKYQIMGSNIGDWSQAALGKRLSIAEFMASPESQDKIFDHRFGGYVKKFGNPQDAASMWLTGKPLSGGANLRDLNGTSGADYVQRFNAEGGGGSNTSTEVHINTVNVTPPAGANPDAWAASFAGAVRRQSFAAQANSGQQ
jgi:hypothetical protein